MSTSDDDEVLVVERGDAAPASRKQPREVLLASVSSSELFEKDKKDPRRVICLVCRDEGMAEEKCSGKDLSDWGMRHSLKMHPNESKHAQWRQEFDSNSRRKRARDVEETKSTTASTSTSSSRGTVTAFLKSHENDVTRDDIIEAVIKFLIKNSLPLSLAPELQELINLACTFGHQTHHISVSLPGRNTLTRIFETKMLPAIVKLSVETTEEHLNRTGCALSVDGKRDANSRSVTICTA